VKTRLSAFLILLIAAAILWYLRGRTEQPTLTAHPKQLATPPEVLANPTPKLTSPSAQSASAPKLPVAKPNESAAASEPAPTPLPLNQVTPSIGALREEIKKDPHTTPQSLLRFGLSVGQRMEKALASETTASAFLNELEECVATTSHDVPQAAQALCIESARDLAQKYPSLSARAEQLAAQADPAVARLVH
jgi:hypothetical protein